MPLSGRPCREAFSQRKWPTPVFFSAVRLPPLSAVTSFTSIVVTMSWASEPPVRHLQLGDPNTAKPQAASFHAENTSEPCCRRLLARPARSGNLACHRSFRSPARRPHRHLRRPGVHRPTVAAHGDRHISAALHLGTRRG